MGDRGFGLLWHPGICALRDTRGISPRCYRCRAETSGCPPAREERLLCLVVFRFLDRGLFPAIRDRVRPGGLVIYQTFNVRQRARRPSVSAEHMLRLGELPGHFPGWEVIEASDEGYVSTFVGRKPGG